MQLSASRFVLFLFALATLIPVVCSQGFFFSGPAVDPPEDSNGNGNGNGDDDENGDEFLHANYIYGMWPGTPRKETCVCNCNNMVSAGQKRGLECEWKMVFKSVAGNGRHAYYDWVGTGGLNFNSDEAMEVTSTMPYRNNEVLDNWNQVYVQRVLVEIYREGIRQTWFYFDATASDITSWMAADRLMASPYSDLKSGTHDVFSVLGEISEERRFLINRESPGCVSKCGYLMVVDPKPTTACSFEGIAAEPFFLYGTRANSCGVWDDPSQYGVGDRLVISLKVCNVELTSLTNTVWVETVV